MLRFYTKKVSKSPCRFVWQDGCCKPELHPSLSSPVSFIPCLVYKVECFEQHVKRHFFTSDCIPFSPTVFQTETSVFLFSLVPDHPAIAATTEGARSPRAHRPACIQPFGARRDSYHPRHLQRQAAQVRRHPAAAATSGSPGNRNVGTRPCPPVAVCTTFPSERSRLDYTTTIIVCSNRIFLV